jgi:molybdate transport system permease protein
MKLNRRVPVVLVIPAVLALVLLLVPLAALLVRIPWADLPRVLAGDTVWPALRLSLLSASVATVISMVVGVPLAWVIGRSDSRGMRLLRALVTLPLVLPPVVGGITLLMAFGRRGIVGGPLYSLTGWSIPFTSLAVVMAQTFVAMPFLVISVAGAVERLDPRFDEAAASLGASGLYAFRRVTLPMLAPGILAGTVLAWTRALGEFGATITFAGAFPGRTETMPIAVYLAQQSDPDAALALSAVLLLVSLAVLVALRRHYLPGAVT